MLAFINKTEVTPKRLVLMMLTEYFMKKLNKAQLVEVSPCAPKQVGRIRVKLTSCIYGIMDEKPFSSSEPFYITSGCKDP